MKTSAILVALAGLALTIGLIAYSGWQAIGQSLLAVGWWGMLAITAYHIPVLVCSALGWRALLFKRWPAARWIFVRARWIREHVAHLLPVAQVGGEIVGARILTIHGLAPPLAVASVIVDLTLEAATQVVFTFMGLGVLATIVQDRGLLKWIALGTVIGALLIGGFLWAQRHGLFAWLETGLKKIATGGPAWASLGRFDGLNDSIQTLYADRGGVALASGYHFACWILGVGETWLALYFIGHPVSWADALFLESLGEAVRGAAFFIPGQLGVQEGGYMLLGEALGLAPEVGITLSLIKRVRILLLGLPALLTWQFLEGRSVLKKHRDSGF